MDRSKLKLSERAHQWPLIMVEVEPDSSNPFTTWAVAVYESPEGLAWVEPHYIDTWATRPAAHAWAGTLRWERNQARLDGEQSALVREPTDDEREDAERAQRAWTTWVEEQGREEGEERDRLLTELKREGTQ